MHFLQSHLMNEKPVVHDAQKLLNPNLICDPSEKFIIYEYEQLNNSIITNKKIYCQISYLTSTIKSLITINTNIKLISNALKFIICVQRSFVFKGGQVK